jgi:hypothetical protein
MSQALHQGAVVFYVVWGGLLTFVLAALALAVFRRAVARNMAAASAAHAAVIDTGPRRAATAPLTVRIETPQGAVTAAGPSDRALRRLALAHALAGLAFGLVAALLLLLLSGMEIWPLRTAALTWAYAWPAVPVLCLVVGPDRGTQGRILFTYFGGLLVLCALAWLIGAPPLHLAPLGLTLPGLLSPFVLWLVHAAPSLFLLLFLNRAVRAVGPLVLVFVLIALVGTHVALSILAIDPVMRAAGEVAVQTGLGGHGVFWGVVLLGLLAGSWPAARAAVFLSKRYAAKRFSNLMLTASAIWLLETLWITSGFYREAGALGLAAAVLPFAAWAVTLNAALRPLAAEARSRRAPRLLLLRVFGFGRRSQRLLDLLGTRWRLVGSIDLIAAPDLAPHVVEPSTFLEFVRGNLARLFVRTPADLQDRLAAADRSPDPDGRFRINQFFCSGDVWKAAVMSLMDGAALVVMDLRGFGPQHRGCAFELQTLLDMVELQRLVLVVDATTDRGTLETLLQERWRELDADSPNLAVDRAEVRLLDAAQDDAQAVRHLLP